MHSFLFQVEGISCQACQKIIQKRLGNVQGVSGVSVELNGQLEVKADRAVDKSELVNALKDTDYKIL